MVFFWFLILFYLINGNVLVSHKFFCMFVVLMQSLFYVQIFHSWTWVLYWCYRFYVAFIIWYRFGFWYLFILWYHFGIVLVSHTFLSYEWQCSCIANFFCMFVALMQSLFYVQIFHCWTWVIILMLLFLCCVYNLVSFWFF